MFGHAGAALRTCAGGTCGRADARKTMASRRPVDSSPHQVGSRASLWGGPRPSRWTAARAHHPSAGPRRGVEPGLPRPTRARGPARPQRAGCLRGGRPPGRRRRPRPARPRLAARQAREVVRRQAVCRCLAPAAAARAPAGAAPVGAGPAPARDASARPSRARRPPAVRRAGPGGRGPEHLAGPYGPRPRPGQDPEERPDRRRCCPAAWAGPGRAAARPRPTAPLARCRPGTGGACARRRAGREPAGVAYPVGVPARAAAGGRTGGTSWSPASTSSCVGSCWSSSPMER